MLFAIKAPLYPTIEQKELFTRNFEAARWVYNDALRWKKMCYRAFPFPYPEPVNSNKPDDPNKPKKKPKKPKKPKKEKKAKGKKGAKPAQEEAAKVPQEEPAKDVKEREVVRPNMIHLEIQTDVFSLGTRLTRMLHEVNPIIDHEGNPIIEGVNRGILNQALYDLDSAFQRFFKGLGGFPKFKRLQDRKFSCGYPSGVKIDIREKGNHKVFIPSLGWVDAFIYRHKEIPEQAIIKTCRVKLRPTGKWYVSLLFDDGVAMPIPSSKVTNLAGIDLGLKDFLATSDGQKVGRERFLDNAARNVRRKQKALARKQKGSKNQEKARIALAKASERVANQRETFHYKVIAEQLNHYDAVGVETLRIQNMMKNRRLSRSISDVGWNSFVAKLESKFSRHGLRVVKVGTFFPSSKICSACGYKMESMPLRVREWTCPQCGAKHDRDVNAAKTIKTEAKEILLDYGVTVEGTSRPPRDPNFKVPEKKVLYKARRKKKAAAPGEEPKEPRKPVPCILR